MKSAPLTQPGSVKSPLPSLLLLSTLLLGGIEVVADESAVLITTAKVSELRFHPQYSAPATTLSLNSSRISAETTGRIHQLPVRVGDLVKEGELLAALVCTDNALRLRQAEAAVTTARAQLTLADRQIKRTRSLHKDRNISEELFNQREADQKSARAGLASAVAAKEEADVAVQRCRITAPFSGVVMERIASEGEWITPGQPLLQLLDSERLEVSAQIPINLVPSLTTDIAYILDTNRQQYKLKLRHLVPVVASKGRNREARLLFTETRALPGSSGRLLWNDANPHLPSDLLVQRDNRLGVLFSNDGVAHFHPLPEALEGHPAAIPASLSGNLITEGRQGLSDGDAVREKE